MFVFLSKILPPFVYPLGLACLLILLALVLQKRPRGMRLSLILALALLWASSSRWVAYGLTRSLEWRYLPPAELSSDQTGKIADVIVVLGGGTDSAQFPRPMVEVNGAGDRVIYAAHLFRLGKADHLLLTGGRIDWLEAGDPPAVDMASLLEMMGVPRTALWLETESLNTYENAVNSRRLLEEKGIRRIILVTSAMHMPRAVGLFRGQGLEVIPAPTDYSLTQKDWEMLFEPNLATQLVNLLPSANNLSQVSGALKEYLGLLVYWLRGWV